MSKTKTMYICSNCDYETTGYFGKCPSCGSWGTLTEKPIMAKSTIESKVRNLASTPKKLAEISISSNTRIQTNIGELNRVLGNGIVRDSVTIVTAKPGAGKSTLLLQLSEDLAKQNYKVLYASGEESESQIRNRADRLDISSDNIWVMSTNSINAIQNEIEEIDPDILIFDSIQTITDDNLTQKSGSPTQVNEVSSKIVNISKYSNKKRASFIVGQMTKQDELAGVRTLEHLVDCVLILETGESDQIRTLYSTKNRYGDTGEVGFFEMTEGGLISIDNPSEFFVSNESNSFGKSLSVLKHGSRYIIGEVESLVSKSYFPYPQRISESVRRDNLNIIASILEETAGIPLEDKNIILKTTGGAKINDVSADFSIAMSIVSSYYKKSLGNDVVFCGEIGLTGNVKKVQNIKHRLNEVSRLGYSAIVVSDSQIINQEMSNLKIIKVKNLKEAIKLFF
ncbi:MAG: DNA repair protein RadA [Tissierellia bacterium]|nr:DNA repair protein RadA [Tissierellia bacterium]